MDLMQILQTALGQNTAGDQADQIRKQEGLPPMSLGQNFNQAISDLEQAAGQPFLRGMDSLPIGPGRLPRIPGGVPATPGMSVSPRPGPISGTVQGGPLVPQGPRPQIGRGNVYDGTVVPPGTVPGPAPGIGAAPGTAGSAGGQAGQSGLVNTLMRAFGGGGDDAAAAASRAKRSNTTGVRPDSGPIPMGGPQGSVPRPGGQPQESTGVLAGIQRAFGNLTGAQKAGVAGTGAIASMQVPEVLSRIFGGDPATSETARRLPLPDWAKSGSGGGGGGRAVNELPAAWRSQLEQDIPGIDWESLPRPDYAQARGMLAELAPEAPEERNWLDKLPVSAKNIIGFGILLGPLGLLLGAGIGASANKQIDKAQADAHKEEAREYMREMIGFDLDWAKAERSLALEEQQGRRNQALENIELERQFQQWGMDDMSWQEDMARSQAQRAAMMRQGSGAQGDPMQRLWNDALMQAPDQVIGMYNALSGTPEAMTAMQGSAAQQEMYNKMLQANILRSLYGQ